MKFFDGFKNLITGMGTTRDKATYSQFDYRISNIPDEELIAYYRQLWSAKAIDCKVDDMTKNWRSFNIQSVDPEKIEDIKVYETKLDLKNKMNWAYKMANVFGGALVVMHFKGLGELDEELDWSKITKDSLERITVVDRRDVTYTSNIKMQNPFSSRFGIPDHYMYSFATDKKIHPSRTIKVLGNKVPTREFIENNYWGDSEFERISDSAKSVETVMGGITSLLHEANIDVYGIEGLSDMLRQSGGQDKIKALMELTNLGKSMYGFFIKDAKDTYERKPVNFATLPDILDKFLDIFAGASNVPKTRLLNQSPNGLSGKGESEHTNYLDGISGMQESRLRPTLDVIDKALVVSALGSMPEDYSYEFNPLEREDETEEATNNKTKAETLDILVNSLGMPEVVALKDAKECGLTSNLTEEDIEELNFKADNSPEDDLNTVDE